jgi:prevent-host-death family protein
MQRTSVANLKARLSEFLAAVRAGEDIIITDRGQPIARLTALENPEGRDARVAELVRAGIMRPPKQRLPKNFRAQPRGSDVSGSVLRALLDEREAGW